MRIGVRLVVLVLMLSGCASVSIHDPMPGNHKQALVLSYCVSSSSELANLKAAVSDEQNKKAFNDNIAIAIEDINNSLRSGIKHTDYFRLVALPECVNDIGGLDPAVDLYLKVDLSGYGSLKRKWKNVLIGTGIIEGIVQGIIVSAATSNPGLGVAVASEEIIQEYLTWNGVEWIFGEAYAPVTLEGKLFYVRKNEVIWSDTSFVTENEAVLTESEKQNKSFQLRASLHKAEDKLVSSLNDYLQKEILKKITSGSD